MLVATKILAAWAIALGLFMLGFFLIYSIKIKKDKFQVKFGAMHALFGIIIAVIGGTWIFCF